jgi:mono/diheme cytochrome c family protein
MKMPRPFLLRVSIAVIVALAALLFVQLRNASGAAQPFDSVSAGHRLAAAWCSECHSIAAEATLGPPAFVAIANRTSTTALSLKVFLGTSHRNMPNLIIAPNEADDLVNYILSLKRN